MANEGDKADDVSSMMEELGVPASDPRVDEVSLPRAGGGIREIPSDGDGAGLGTTEPAGRPDDGMRHLAEGLLKTQARQSRAIELVTSELSALRVHLDVVFGQVADELAGTREDAVSTVDERVAEAETRLLGRLDEIATGLVPTAQRSAVDDDDPGQVSLDAMRSELDVGLAGMREAQRTFENHPNAGLKRIQAELATLSAGVQESARAQEELGRLINGLVERVSRSEDKDSAASEALEWRITSAVNQLTEGIDAQEAELRAALEARVERLPTTKAFDRLRQRVEAQHAEVRTALEAEVEQLQLAIDREAARAGAAVDRAERAGLDVARIAAESEGLVLAQEDLSRRFDQVIERLEQLQGQDLSVLATREEVARLEQQLSQRLDRMAEQVAEATSGPLPEGSDAGRLQALEDHARHSDAEMSELNDLHAALDTGLGTLRSEIAVLRNAMRKMAADQVDRVDRAEFRPEVRPVADVEQGRGRRKDRKGPIPEMAALLAATENMAREQQQLKADVAELEQEAQLARAVASRPPAETQELASLRRDLTAVGEQLAEHNEALDTLRETIAAKPAKSPAKKRANAPASRPATKRAPPTTKG